MPGLQEKDKAIFYRIMIAITAALLSWSISKETRALPSIRYFFTGFICGLMMVFATMNFNIKDGYKDLLVLVGAGFVYLIWPVAGKLIVYFVEKFGKKKIDSLP